MPLGSFVFDEKVVDVFPDMINRSVPGYSTIISMIGTLAARYVQADTRCYDLGCSLGAATLSIRHNIENRHCEIIAVDNSEAMTQGCQSALTLDESTVPVTVLCEDILDTTISNASLVVMNFTLQFVPLEHRNTLISRVFAGMRPGGMLILSEKIRFEDPALDELFIDMHHRFKEQQGYSKLEISRKRTALENVLIPETIAEHEQRIRGAGFDTYDVWFQCFNFVSMVAVKA